MAETGSITAERLGLSPAMNGRSALEPRSGLSGGLEFAGLSHPPGRQKLNAESEKDQTAAATVSERAPKSTFSFPSIFRSCQKDGWGKFASHKWGLLNSY
jgi:hypothetical protein